MSLFRAYFDTRHFDFEGYGASAAEAVEVCFGGWLRHCATYRPGVEIDTGYVTRADISVYEIAVGEAYRDRESIG